MTAAAPAHGEPSEHPHWSWPRRVAASLAVLAATAGVAVPAVVAFRAVRSGANVSDAESVGLNRLGAATLDIEIGSEAAPMVAENLAPGDVVTGEVEVINAGDLPLRYAVTASSGGGELGGWLRFDLWATDVGCVSGPEADALIDQGIALTEPSVALVGDPATGAQPGDRGLAPATRELLCLRATLPLDAPNTLQGASLTFDLVVDAEHDLEASEASS